MFHCPERSGALYHQQVVFPRCPASVQSHAVPFRPIDVRLQLIMCHVFGPLTY